MCGGLRCNGAGRPKQKKMRRVSAFNAFQNHHKSLGSHGGAGNTMVAGIDRLIIDLSVILSHSAVGFVVVYKIL